MFFSYILQSKKTKRYYIGSTDDVKNRLEEHNTGETVSIRRGIPWKIVHAEQFSTRSEAIRKENQIKARGAQRYLDDLNKPGERVAPMAPRSGKSPRLNKGIAILRFQRIYVEVISVG